MLSINNGEHNKQKGFGIIEGIIILFLFSLFFLWWNKDSQITKQDIKISNASEQVGLYLDALNAYNKRYRMLFVENDPSFKSVLISDLQSSGLLPPGLNGKILLGNNIKRFEVRRKVIPTSSAYVPKKDEAIDIRYDATYNDSNKEYFINQFDVVVVTTPAVSANGLKDSSSALGAIYAHKDRIFNAIVEE